MQYVYVINNVVVGIAKVAHSYGVAPSGPTGSAEYTVSDSVAVGIGYAFSLSQGQPVFTAPANTYAVLTPMQFYLAFTPAERMAIKKSADPNVNEFWATYQLAAQLNNTIDPNLVSAQEALTYLATPTTATPPGAGILASTARIAQISNGTPQ